MTPIEHGTADCDGDVERDDQFDEQDDGKEGKPEERGLALEEEE